MAPNINFNTHRKANMPILLNELLKEANLTEDQQKLLDSLQDTVNTQLNSDIESAKNGLISKNQELLDKLKAAKEKAIPDGFDMDGYNEYIQKKDEIEEEKRKAEEEALIAKQNWDKLKNDMTNSHEETIRQIKKEKDDAYNTLKTHFDNMLIENVALKEIEKVEGSQTLLMPHIKAAIQTGQDDKGNYVVNVIDPITKEARMNKDTGNPLKVSELIAEFQANEAFAGAFPIQNKGSNTNVNINNGNYNSQNNPFDKSSKNFSITEQAKLRKSNPELAKTLEQAVG